jgi:hypothetical protein
MTDRQIRTVPAGEIPAGAARISRGATGQNARAGEIPAEREDEMSNLAEPLEAARKAGDLRRKETLRLIEAASQVAVAICNAARDAGVEAVTHCDGMSVAVERDPSAGVKGWGLVVYEGTTEWSEPASEQPRAKRAVVAADSQAHASWWLEGREKLQPAPPV